MKTSDPHLTAEELVDVAEAARSEASMPHLQTCDVCARRVTEHRAAMSDVRDVDVPEPSPLFWSQFSRRVSEAVDSERRPARTEWLRWATPRSLIPLSAVAVA